MRRRYLGRTGSLLLAGTLFLGTLLMGGCGSSSQQSQTAASVKTMKVLQQDTPLTYSYAGDIKAKDEVKVQPKVSGTVVEKYIKGGQYVQAGQPLYKLDSRQYESTLLSKKAALSQDQAKLQNKITDLQRDQSLYASGAIAEQTMTTQQADVDSYQAAVDADEALVKKAQEDLDDTVVYAPIAGKLAVDDVAVGTYATPGSTTLVTIGSSSPVYVQFSISESDYLKTIGQSQRNGDFQNVHLVLSDSSEYPLLGSIVEADRALADQTGTLKLKALFDNPDGLLIPGMFARVKFIGATVPNALLVPQRAVQQVLSKSFVMVVDEDGKSKAKTIELGDKVGSYYIVKSGLSANDEVVVEGLTGLQEGKALSATPVTAEEMGFSLDESTEDDSSSDSTAGSSAQ